jgi:hypothetical protein
MMAKNLCDFQIRPPSVPSKSSRLLGCQALLEYVPAGLRYVDWLKSVNQRWLDSWTSKLWMLFPSPRIPHAGPGCTILAMLSCIHWLRTHLEAHKNRRRSWPCLWTWIMGCENTSLYNYMQICVSHLGFCVGKRMCCKVFQLKFDFILPRRKGCTW